MKPLKDLRQTEEYANYMRGLGWKIQKLNDNCVFIKSIPLLGKVAKLQRYPGTLDKSSIDQIKASVVYLEPLEETPTHFDQLKRCFLPSKTIQINLTLSTEDLLKNLKQKTRYNIKVAHKNKLVITKSQDINTFLKLWHGSARERGMWLSQKNEIASLWKAFNKKASLYFASLEGEVLAGLFTLHTNDTAYYMYAASSENGKSLFAPTFLTWEAILEAKKNKKKVFDFDGIYDERFKNTKNWKGFTKFKEGFGGEIVTYPGTFAKYNNPLLKILNF